ncbi:MAG TPA: hypothetical protein VGG34_06765 [Opitutaceae bacterium]|jgi:hypothetical protein
MSASVKGPEEHFTPPRKLSTALGDLLVVAIFIAAAILFFSKNGFVGSAGIQPYPY